MDEEQERRNASSRYVFLLVFGIVALANFGVFAIGWTYSVDLRGWWPIVVAFQFFNVLVYALVFTAIAWVTTAVTTRFTIVYNSLLAVALLVHTVLFYTIRLDTQAANHPPSTLYRVIHSGVTVYAIYGAFLLGALLVGRGRKKVS